MSSAVVICLDRNKFVEQESGYPIKYFYETEAITCVKSWRENAKWQDNIYAIEYIDREVSEQTRSELKKLDVNIINLNLPNIEHPFMEVVYALTQVENEKFIKEDRIFYSDLDIIMQQPVPLDFFNLNNTILYYYDFNNINILKDSKEFIYRLNCGNKLNMKCHNTYFQVFTKNNNFQQTVYNISQTQEYQNFFEKNIYYQLTDDDYFFEEGAYDYTCLKYQNNFNIIDLKCPSTLFKHIHAHKQYLK